MISSQRHLFDLPDDVAYLRCAACAPQMNSVHLAGLAGLEGRAQPWYSDKAVDFDAIDALRALFADLIGATADDVAIVPAASYGLSTAAANLPIAEAEEILILDAQFPSNVYPWRMLANESGAEIVIVARPSDSDWTASVLAAINEKTAIVALPWCHWTDGSRLDLVTISERTRAMEAALVLDLSQSLGAVPFDVAEIKPDFLVSVGQKWLMGPHQLSYFYAAPERQFGRPIEHNWVNRRGSEDHTALVNYIDDYHPGARRYDGGARGNPLAIPMAHAALQQIHEWGVAEISETIAPMIEDIAARAEDLNLEPTPERVRAPHMIGLRARDGLPADLLEHLAAADVYVSVRGDAIRVAPNVYNTGADLEQLFDVLAKVLDH